MTSPEPPPSTSLQALARKALRALILEGRLSPGDLIKLLSMEENAEAPCQPRDFVIHLIEEEGP